MILPLIHVYTLIQYPCFYGFTGAKNADQLQQNGNAGEIKREVKPGQITDSDRLFNELSKHISKKYSDIGIELGLGFDYLENELETGIYENKSADKKAMKMLHLWKKSATEENFTYAVLAAALEKWELNSCAEKSCYTTDISK